MCTRALIAAHLHFEFLLTANRGGDGRRAAKLHASYSVAEHDYNNVEIGMRINVPVRL